MGKQVTVQPSVKFEDFWHVFFVKNTSFTVPFCTWKHC